MNIAHRLLPTPKKHAALLAVTVLVSACNGTQPVSLAPPPPELSEGRPAPVVAHHDQLSLLASADPALAANKRLVFDMWRTLWSAGQLDQAEHFLASDYSEHSLMVPNGLEGFRQYHGARLARQETVPATISAPIVTLIAEADLVGVASVEYYYEPDGSGNTYTSTRFDLFRIADGKIAEHWDSGSLQPGSSLLSQAEGGPVPVKGTQGHEQLPMLANADWRLANNKRLAFDLWRHTSEAGREEMALLYLDPIYIQHNPNAATGREGFMGYFAQRPDTSIETYLENPLVAVVAEGDLVMQALQGERRHPDKPDEMVVIAWFDMFRVENGRLIEHWDNAAKGEVPKIMEDTFVNRPD